MYPSSQIIHCDVTKNERADKLTSEAQPFRELQQEPTDALAELSEKESKNESSTMPML